MPCKLCKQDKPLIQAHIIPNFMYKGIFNEDNFFIKAPMDDLSKGYKVSTGYFDKKILCKECDNDIIGRYETYASRAMYGGKLPDTVKPQIQHRVGDDGAQDIFITNIDYKSYKLFLLSILWRASITTRPEFSQVSLGTRYEEKIRQMLLNNDPKGNEDFPVGILHFNNGHLPSKMIGDFVRLKDEGNTSYAIIINEFFYMFSISKHKRLDIYNKISIDQNNEMSIGILEGEMAARFFDRYTRQKLRLQKPYK